MRLNHDLVRDILLFVESNQGYTSKIISSDQMVEITNHSGASLDEMNYAINKLGEAGYIELLPLMGKQAAIRSITWDGHQFLDNIRDKTIWEKTKRIVSTTSSASLPIVAEVASNLLFKTLDL